MIVIGITKEDIQLLGKVNLTDKILTLKPRILEEYKSNNLKEPPKENYKDNLPTVINRII